MSFCMYCGRELKEGEEHICPEAPVQEVKVEESNAEGVGETAVEENAQQTYQQQAEPNMGQTYQQQTEPSMSQAYQQQGAPNMGQSYQQQAMPNMGQSYQQQGMPNMGQSYQQQGMLNMGQGYQQQGMPNMGQGYQQQGMPNMSQGYQQQGMPNMGQGYQQQGMPNMGQPMQNGMPYMGYPNQPMQQGNPQFDRMKQVSGSYVKKMVETWVNLLVKPITAGKKMVQEVQYPIAIGMLVIQALLTAFFGMALASRYNGLYGSYIEEAKNQGFAINQLSMFFGCFAGSLLCSVILAGLLFAGIKIAKGNSSFLSVLSAVGARAVPMHIVQLVAIVSTFVNVKLGIAFFLLSFLVGICVAVPIACDTSGMNMDAKPYIVTVVVILTVMITYYLVSKVGTSMFLPNGIQDMIGKIMEEYEEVMEELSELGSYYR